MQQVWDSDSCQEDLSKPKLIEVVQILQSVKWYNGSMATAQFKLNTSLPSMTVSHFGGREGVYKLNTTLAFKFLTFHSNLERTKKLNSST